MIGVIFLLPVGDDRACFVNMVEGVHVQTLVPDAVVKGFNESVAPGLPGWNVMDSKLLRSELF